MDKWKTLKLINEHFLINFKDRAPLAPPGVSMNKT